MVNTFHDPIEFQRSPFHIGFIMMRVAMLRSFTKISLRRNSDPTWQLLAFGTLMYPTPGISTLTCLPIVYCIGAMQSWDWTIQFTGWRMGRCTGPPLGLERESSTSQPPGPTWIQAQNVNFPVQITNNFTLYSKAKIEM